MVPRNSERGAALLDAVNAQLASMRESGELRTIINRYLDLYQLQYGFARRSATGRVR